MRWEVGSIWLVGMAFPGKGVRVAVDVTGSKRVLQGSKMFRSPPEAFRDCEKSPLRSRAVGNVSMFSRGVWVRHCSPDVNVNSLFLLIGLPRVAPQMWLRTWFG